MSKIGGKSSGDGKNTLYCSFCGKSQHEVRKLIAANSRNETVERRKSDVFFIPDATEILGQPLGRDSHEPLEIFFPKLFGCFFITGPHLLEQFREMFWCVLHARMMMEMGLEGNGSS